MENKYDGEKDIISFSQLYNSGIRISLRKNFKKVKEIQFNNLAMPRYNFMVTFAKSLGRGDNGFNDYAWKLDDGGIFLRLSVNAMMAFAKVLEEYAVNGEHCIYEKPVTVFSEDGEEEINVLKNPGFSRVIGQKVKKTYKIVLNKQHYKDKSYQRSIAILVTENKNTCPLTLELPDAYALSQQIKKMCEIAIAEDFKDQMKFTLSGSSKDNRPGKIDVDELDSEPPPYIKKQLARANDKQKSTEDSLF